MADKADVQDMIEKSKEWAGWQEHLCIDCKAKIISELQPVVRMYNKGGLRKRMAEARMAAMTLTLWRKLCNKCIAKIKNKIQEGDIHEETI